MKLKIAILTIIFWGGVYGFGADAVWLNKVGYQFLQKKDYVKAMEYFQKSFESEPTYVFPRYNYACAASLFLSENYCEAQEYESKAFEQLKIVLALSNQYIKNIMKDKDLAFLRQYFQYYKVLDYPLNKASEFFTILIYVNWGVAGMGVISPVARIKFDSGYKVRYSTWSWSDEGGDIVNKIYNGSYKIERNKDKNDFVIKIKFDDPVEGVTDFEGTMDDSGILKINDLNIFVTFIAECGA